MNTFGQKQGNVWYFGGGYGLDFNPTDGPVLLTDGAMDPFEGCASISDKISGKLLFYTDGVSVWDSSHSNMPNGFGLWGHASSTQSGVIIPWPGSDSLFYIFTVDAQAGADVFNSTDTGRYGGIAYSVVNMSLNGGLGAVTTKNKGLITPASEKITGIWHCNGKDIWVITHQWETNAFYAYLVTSSGIDPVAVISHAGSIHTDKNGNSNMATLGYMKVSSNGKKLVLAIGDPVNRVEIFDFNSSTGNISNPVIDYLSDTLVEPWNQSPYSPYGLSFSPNNQFVYVSVAKRFAGNGDSSKIFQYDLLAGNAGNIVNSKVTVAGMAYSSGGLVTAMQMGPDNKIYINQRYNNYLGTIESPDKPGGGVNGCNYNAKTVYKGTGSGRINYGLPTFMESFFGQAQNISLGPDITVCKSDVILNAGNGATYIWSTGATSQAITVSSSGTYTVLVSGGNNCLSQNGSVDLLVNPFIHVNSTSDTSVCGTPTVLLNAGKGTSYIWSTGATSQNISVSSQGSYSVEVNTGKNCVLNNKNMNVIAHDFPVVNLPKDTSVCGIPLVLNAEYPGSAYLWSNGSTSASINVNTSGTFTVIVNNGYCQTSGISKVDYITFTEKFSPPNIFSPNGDGKNDIFDLKIPYAEFYDLKIFNRWGKLVYESQNNTDTWNADQLNEGVYYWILNYAVCSGQTARIEKGSVTIVK